VNGAPGCTRRQHWRALAAGFARQARRHAGRGRAGRWPSALAP